MRKMRVVNKMWEIELSGSVGLGWLTSNSLGEKKKNKLFILRFLKKWVYYNFSK